MKKITCKICGKQEDVSHFYDDYAAELESHQMCHTSESLGTCDEYDAFTKALREKLIKERK